MIYQIKSQVDFEESLDLHLYWLLMSILNMMRTCIYVYVTHVIFLVQQGGEKFQTHDFLVRDICRLLISLVQAIR